MGISAYIIPDLDEYYKNIKRKQNEGSIERFFRQGRVKDLKDCDLEEIFNIINKYKK